MNANLRDADLDLPGLFKRAKPYLPWVLLLASLLGGITFLISSSQAPVYQASARVLAAQGSSLTPGSFGGTIPVATVLDAGAYREAALSNQVTTNTLKALGQPHSALELERFRRNLRVRVVEGTQSNVLILSVLNRNPAQSARFANAWAEQLAQWDVERVRGSFKNYRTSLEAQLKATDSQIARLDPANPSRSSLQTLKVGLLRDLDLMRALESSANGQITLLDGAIAPLRPVGPRSLLNALGAFGLGFVVALALALLRDANERRVRSADEAYRVTGLPVLGEFPEALNSYSFSLSPEVADYLEINLSHAAYGSSKPKSILVSSPMSSEGKSSVAVSLARASAKAGKHTLLIDLNTRAPALYQEFKIYRGDDIVGMLDNPLQGAPSTHMVEPNLEFIPCLQTVEAPSRLLADGFRPFMRKLAETTQYDVVIIDTPPILSVTDTLVIAPYVSGVLLVAQAGQTDRVKLRSALAILKRVGAQVLGLVVNRASGSEAFVLVGEERERERTPSKSATTAELRPTVEYNPNRQTRH